MERIEGHEKLCTERWNSAHKLLERLDKRWWWLLVAIIAGNLGTQFFVDHIPAVKLHPVEQHEPVYGLPSGARP